MTGAQRKISVPQSFNNPTLLSLLELIELFEAMTVDDFLQFAVGVVADEVCVIEDHDFAILGRIGMPDGKSVYLWVSCLGKLCPYAAHDVSQS